MTAASNSESRKRNTSPVDPVEVVQEYAIRFNNGHMRPMPDLATAEALFPIRSDSFARIVVRDVTPWRES